MAASPVQDELTPELWRRLLNKEGRGVAAKAGLLVVGAFVAAVAGPGIALGRHVIYRVVVDHLAPRIGRLSWWPWAVAAGALAVLRWVLTDWPVLGVALGVGRYFPGDFVMFGGWAAWAQWQAVVALATTAYAVHAWGWAGVGSDAVAPPAKKKDGSWNTVVDVAKARQIDPYAGEEPPVAPTVPTKRVVRRRVAPESSTPTVAERLGNADPLPTTEAIDADDLSDIDFIPGEFEGLPDRFDNEEH
ncbi:hypothetical protein ACIQYZ_13530 [Rhodococcus erythropolis]